MPLGVTRENVSYITLNKRGLMPACASEHSQDQPAIPTSTLHRRRLPCYVLAVFTVQSDSYFRVYSY